MVVHVVDINDRSPEFEQNVYIAQVSEDIEEGSLVARVKATDEDSGIEHILTLKCSNFVSTSQWV